MSRLVRFVTKVNLGRFLGNVMCLVINNSSVCKHAFVNSLLMLTQTHHWRGQMRLVKSVVKRYLVKCLLCLPLYWLNHDAPSQFFLNHCKWWPKFFTYRNKPVLEPIICSIHTQKTNYSYLLLWNGPCKMHYSNCLFSCFVF